MGKRPGVVDSSLTLVALAALCWGVSGGFAALLMADGWDAAVLALYRGAVGLLFAVAWLALRPRRSGLSDRRLWFWAAIAGLGVAGNFLFYFVGIAEVSVAVAATLMYCAPIYVYLLSVLLGIEASDPWRWLAVALVMLGIVLLTGVYDTGAGGITLPGIGYGLLSGLCYAAFIFAFRYAAPRGSPQAILVVAFAVLVAALAGPSDFSRVLLDLGSPDWPLLGALGVLGAGLSFFLYVTGMRYARPTLAAMIAMIEPVTASLFGVVILGEQLMGLQIVGMGLVLFTVTALSVRSDP